MGVTICNDIRIRLACSLGKGGLPGSIYVEAIPLPSSNQRDAHIKRFDCQGTSNNIDRAEEQCVTSSSRQSLTLKLRETTQLRRPLGSKCTTPSAATWRRGAARLVTVSMYCARMDDRTERIRWPSKTVTIILDPMPVNQLPLQSLGIKVVPRPSVNVHRASWYCPLRVIPLSIIPTVVNCSPA